MGPRHRGHRQWRTARGARTPGGRPEPARTDWTLTCRRSLRKSARPLSISDLPGRRTGESGSRQAPMAPLPDPGGGEMRLTRTAIWALALTSVAFFMTALDALVVITALPAVHASLGGSVSTLEWTVNAYTLTLAAGIITAAALGDRLGRRR